MIQKVLWGLLIAFVGWAAVLARPLVGDGALRLFDFLITGTFPPNPPSLRWTTHLMQIPTWIFYQLFPNNFGVEWGYYLFNWSYAFYHLIALGFIWKLIAREDHLFKSFFLICFLWIIQPASLFALNYVNECALVFLFLLVLFRYHTDKKWFFPLFGVACFALAVSYESGILFIPVLGIQLLLIFERNIIDRKKLGIILTGLLFCGFWLVKELYRFETEVTTPHTVGFWSSFGRWKYSHLHKSVSLIPIILTGTLILSRFKKTLWGVALFGVLFYFSMVDILIRENPMDAGLSFDLRVWVAPLIGLSFLFFFIWERFGTNKDEGLNKELKKIVLLGLIFGICHEYRVNKGLSEGINYYREMVAGKKGCLSLTKEEVNHFGSRSINDWSIPFWSVVMAKKQTVDTVLGEDFYLKRLPLCQTAPFQEKRGLLRFDPILSRGYQ